MNHSLADIQNEYCSPDTNWADTTCPHPACQSDDIGLEKVDSLMGYQYRCNDCGQTFL